MAGAAGLLAAWLMPVMWLAPAALVARDGPEGVGVALTVALAPLLALAVGAWRADAARAGLPVEEAVLVVVVGLLVWGNLALAGDVAADLGVPRWHGIVVAGGPALVLAAWRGLARLSAALFLLSLAGILLPLLLVALASGLGPAAAWGVLAQREAFQFPARSLWVTEGRALPSAPDAVAIRFDEEHRVSAPDGATVRVWAGGVEGDPGREWRLAPGQSITLRPGDRLEAAPGTRIRFEADRRVPGAPRSGAAWADGRAGAWLARLGLLLTVAGGGVALLSSTRLVRPSRPVAIAVGAGTLAALAWAQGWGVYGSLGAPEVFLGGVTPARLVEVPGLLFAHGVAGQRLQAMLMMGLLAGFVAGSGSLRERASGGSRAGPERDLALWAAVFAAAAVASLRPVDPWTVTLGALGVAASALAAAAVVPASPRVGTAAAGLGLGVFSVLSALGWIHGAVSGAAGIVLQYPALVAMPAALLVSGLGARLARP